MKLVGLFLWRQSYTERIAVGTFSRLRRGLLLTPEERRQTEQFMAEEMSHGDSLRQAARGYIVVRPAEAWPGFTPIGLSEPLALTTTYLGERLMTPTFRLLQRAFDQLGDHETAALYRLIEREEAQHVAWARSVLRRLRREEPSVAAEIRAFMRSHVVVRAFRRVAPDERWIREMAA
jgi:hypothetical protein